jgi:D-aminopeptidase
MTQKRFRDYNLTVGDLSTGEHNAITDMDGVLVGHTTLFSGEGTLKTGTGPIRTGVTVILPHGDNVYAQKVPGAVHTINGFGKPMGFEEVRELGMIESPIALTNTLNVGLVADALVQYAIQHNPNIGVRGPSINAIVGETNDGFLNDIQGRHVRAEHVFKAIDSAASGIVAEGAVGAGTGTTCFQWKGGIGSSSRVLPQEAGGYTVGVLVQTNFGAAKDLHILGVPIGKQIVPPNQKHSPIPDGGSIMTVLATNAPLDPRQLRRLCVRVGAGLARTGSVYNHGSGDFVIAFSTAEPFPTKPDALTTTRTTIANEGKLMQTLFPAIADVVEEAIYNSLFMAETVIGRDGNTRYALPVDEVVRVLGVGER